MCRRCYLWAGKMRDWDLDALGIIPHFIYRAKLERKAQIAALPPDLQGIARHADKLYERALRLQSVI